MHAIGLLGNGAQADEVEDYAPGVEVSFRAVSARFLSLNSPKLIDIAIARESAISTPVTAAIGAPAVRRDLVNSWSGSTYHTVVATTAWVSESARIGEGCIVAPQAALSTRVRLGSHVLVNIGATVSHDSSLGSYTTISPGVHIAGRCSLGDGVFLGVGATVSDRVSIVSGTVVGAGAVVVSNIVTQGIYVGVPARLVRETRDWFRAL